MTQCNNTITTADVYVSGLIQSVGVNLNKHILIVSGQQLPVRTHWRSLIGWCAAM